MSSGSFPKARCELAAWLASRLTACTAKATSPSKGAASIDLRVAHTEDAADILAIYGPIVGSTAISFEEVVPTVEEMEQRILTTLQTYPYLVATRDSRVIGYAYASPHRARAAYRWAVDGTVYIASGERRAGVARRLYVALLPILAK